jgi:FkbM family methyltransferase
MTEVVAPPLASVTNAQGFAIYFNPADERGARLRDSGGDVNPHSLQLWNIALRLHDWQVAVDVGCNYGEMVVGATFPPETKIVAFEPSVSVLPYLEKTLAAYDRPVELLRKAVADEIVEGAQFARDVTWSGKSSLIVEAREDTAADQIEFDTVDVTTLDSVFAARDVTNACIKIDVEGREAAVLRGAATALQAMDKWAIMLEILHASPGELAELVRKYSVYLLDIRLGRLIRIRTTNHEVLRALIGSGWLYPQDALIVSTPSLVSGSR